MALLLLRKTKPALSGCRRFMSYEINGWEVDFLSRVEEHVRLKFANEMKRLPLPSRFGDEELSMTHLSTGLKICFNPLDALKKYKEELKTGDPLQSQFPSYASPFRPTRESFDSAYTGSIYMTQASTKNTGPPVINPGWEYVDWNTACERVNWLSRKSVWPLFKPSTSFYGCLAFYNDYDDALRTDLFRKRNLYSDCSTGQSAYYYLVVKDEGWWIRLVQTYPFCDVTKRVMDMHSLFWDNFVYREIIEYKKDDTRVDEERGNRLSVHFHEVKRLNILEPKYMGVSFEDDNAKKCQSFTTDEWLTSYDTNLTLSKEEVQMLSADRGRRIQSFEQDTKTRLQLLPLFEVTQPKRIYLSGAKKDIKAAKLVLVKYVLGRDRDQTIGRWS